MIITFNKIGVERNFLNLIEKDIYENPQTASYWIAHAWTSSPEDQDQV